MPARPADQNSQPAKAELAAATEKLGRAIRGEVRLDALSRAVYATDASNYRMIPLGVVLPRDREDVEAAVGIAREHAGAPCRMRRAALPAS